jgi:hypothetical protein
MDGIRRRKPDVWPSDVGVAAEPRDSYSALMKDLHLWTDLQNWRMLSATASLCRGFAESREVTAVHKPETVSSCHARDVRHRCKFTPRSLKLRRARVRHGQGLEFPQVAEVGWTNTELQKVGIPRGIRKSGRKEIDPHRLRLSRGRGTSAFHQLEQD